MSLGNNQNIRWYKSLGGKFILLIILILSVVLISGAGFYYLNKKEKNLIDLNHRINNLADLVVSISPSAIYSYDVDELDNYIANLSQADDIVYAVMISPEGDAMTSYLNRDNPFVTPFFHEFNPDNMLEIFDKILDQKTMFESSFPIEFEGELLGIISIGASTQRVEEEAKAILKRQLIFSSSTIFIICFAIYLVFRRYTLGPIEQMVEASNRIAAGTLNQPIEITSQDEMGRLADSFNDMMLQLDKSRIDKDKALAQLTDFNKTLEKHVEQRTLELEELNKALEHQTMHDSLTLLPNRVKLHDRLEQSIYRARRIKQTFTVVMMDLDRFKEVNDTLGHNCGDDLLIEVSKRLLTGLREQDTVSRLGGDEFALVLPDTSIDQAVNVCKKLMQYLEPSFQLHNLEFAISASLGIAAFPEHGETVDELLKASDVAMYVAKREKTGLCIYSQQDDTHLPNTLTLMGELREAIKNNELQLYYQPKIALPSYKIIGVEALARWIHKDKGFIPPDEFIPLAEKTGLIKPLTLWVLNEAMRQAQEWQKSGMDISIAINLSMHNIQDPDLISEIKQLMLRWQVDSQYLVLEITESTIMSSPERVRMVLEEIRSMGIAVSIDDFGTGYSSLSNMRNLPVNELKIDRSFVIQMDSSKPDEAIVKAIIDMAHTIGLKVVAEGVETLDGLKQLEALGCDVIQGYYVSKPLPAQEIVNLLLQIYWSLPESDQ